MKLMTMIYSRATTSAVKVAATPCGRFCSRRRVVAAGVVNCGKYCVINNNTPQLTSRELRSALATRAVDRSWTGRRTRVAAGGRPASGLVGIVVRARQRPDLVATRAA